MRIQKKNGGHRTITIFAVGLCSGVVLTVLASGGQSCNFLAVPQSISLSASDGSNIVSQASSSSSSSSSSVRAPSLDLGLVAGTKLILNIGSNRDPILPRLHVDDICTSAIAFEPIVHRLIPPHHPALHVLPTAVSNFDGMTSMNVYNVDGLSSSIGVPSMDEFWNQGDQDQGSKVVPVLAFSTVMDSLIKKYKVDFIKTDMQGFDFTAISSVKPETWMTSYMVPHLITEIYLDRSTSYVGVSNDLCDDWLPYMKKAGYIFEGLLRPFTGGYESQDALERTCEMQKRRTDPGGPRQKRLESDALWRHFTIPPTDNIPLTYDYPKLSRDELRSAHHNYNSNKKEFAKCFTNVDRG